MNRMQRPVHERYVFSLGIERAMRRLSEAQTPATDETESERRMGPANTSMTQMFEIEAVTAKQQSELRPSPVSESLKSPAYDGETMTEPRSLFAGALIGLITQSIRQRLSRARLRSRSFGHSEPEAVARRTKATIALGPDGLPMPDAPMFTGVRRETADLDKMALLVIRPVLESAGIKCQRWHAFRRGLASILFQLGIDEMTVQRILRQQGPSAERKVHQGTWRKGRVSHGSA